MISIHRTKESCIANAQFAIWIEVHQITKDTRSLYTLGTLMNLSTDEILQIKIVIINDEDDYYQQDKFTWEDFHAPKVLFEPID
ncbi:7974_t:CDS:2 [Entrophospora sp. SA101]|nr:7974_t:CDS:2 [Entrophospora sp. SA101]